MKTLLQVPYQGSTLHSHIHPPVITSPNPELPTAGFRRLRAHARGRQQHQPPDRAARAARARVAQALEEGDGDGGAKAMAQEVEVEEVPCATPGWC